VPSSNGAGNGADHPAEQSESPRPHA